jgi:hypothetical protein
VNINVGQFLEAVTAAQAGRMAGQAAGMQAAQELARQKQMMDLQMEDQRMQRESFRMQQEQFAAGQEQQQAENRRRAIMDRLQVLQPGTPEYVAAQAELAGMGGAAAPGQPQGTTGQFWAPAAPPQAPAAAPAPAPVYKGTTPEAQGVAPAPAPAAQPGVRSPFVNPQENAAKAEFSKLLATGAQETFGAEPELSSEYSQLGMRLMRGQVTLDQAQQEYAQLNARKERKGEARTLYGSVQNIAKDLRAKWDDDRFSPTVKPLVEALLAAEPDPTNVEAMRAWKGQVQKVLSKNPYQKGLEAREAEARAKLSQAQVESLDEDRVVRRLNGLGEKIQKGIAAGNPTSMTLRDIKQYNADARANQKPLYDAGGVYDETPRTFEVEVPILKGEDLPDAPGPGGLMKAIVNASGGTLGTRKIVREETPAEVQARITAAIADETAQTPGAEKRRREAAKEAFSNIEKVLKTVKALDPASRDAYFDRLVKYGGEAGMQMAQIARGLKPEDMTPYMRERIALDKAKFEEQKRQFGVRERRFGEQFQKTYERLSSQTVNNSRLDPAQKEAAMLLRSDIKVLQSERARLQAQSYGTADTSGIEGQIEAKTREWAQIVGATITDNEDGSYSVSVTPTPKVSVQEKPKGGATWETELASLRKLNAALPKEKRKSDAELKAALQKVMKARR